MKVMATKYSVVIFVIITHSSNPTGSPEDLLKELRSLVDLLVHLEPSIVRTLTEKPQVME